MYKIDIEALRTEQHLSEDQLYAAVGLLACITEGLENTSPTDIARATLNRLAGQCGATRLGALLDWWLVVRHGERSHGFAFQVDELMPDGPHAAMTDLREHARASGQGCLTGVRRRRALRAKLDEFAVELHHEQGKVGSQGVTWDRIEAIYRPVFEALESNRQASSPNTTMSEIRTLMREHEVRRGSDIWRKIERDWTRLDNICTEACTLASNETAAYDGPQPPLVEAALNSGSSERERVERFLLGDLLTEAASHAELFNEIALPAQPLGEADAAWFAALTVDYCETHKVQLRSVGNEHQRIKQARKEISRLERSGIDVEWAQLQLDEGSLEDAEHSIEEAKDVRARDDRTRGLQGELEKLRQLAEAADADEDVLAELDLADADIADSALDDAAEKLRQLRDLLATQIEQSRTERGVALLESLLRLGASAPDSLSARVANGTVDEQDLQYLEDAVDQAEAVLRTRVEERLRLGASRLDNEQQLLDATVAQNVSLLLADAREAVSDNNLPVAEDASRRAISLLDQSVPVVWRFDEGEDQLVEHLRRYVTDRLGFSADDIDRMYVGLKTKRFAILSGLTGSGKTTIARLFAESLGASASNGRFTRIAVRPNWVDESDVLGYVNPMTQRFEPGWLATLIKACERMPDLPVFCLLDEMNLAPVEFYLADYLSALEEAASGADTTISLYPSGALPANAEEWPSTLPFPDNLFLIGTVNVDESTRSLSDRVLDRANVLQLSVTVNDRHHRDLQPEDLEPRWQVRMRDWRLACASTPSDAHHDFLVELGEVLNTTMRLGLGVRAHIEIERFIANSEGVIDPVDALDLALLQRIVPKIRGFKRDLAVGLEEMRDLFEEVGASRCQAVAALWLSESISDDDFIDGTHGTVGLVSSR